MCDSELRRYPVNSKVNLAKTAILPFLTHQEIVRTYFSGNKLNISKSKFFCGAAKRSAYKRSYYVKFVYNSKHCR